MSEIMRSHFRVERSQTVSKHMLFHGTFGYKVKTSCIKLINNRMVSLE